MSKYQDPNFDKEAYQKSRAKPSAQLNAMRRQVEREDRIIAAHPGPDWPTKQLTFKNFRKNTRRVRTLQAKLDNEQLVEVEP